MTPSQVLTRVELPLALRVILAGMRTAAVTSVGMATLAFVIGGGGLDKTIDSGLRLERNVVVVTGASLAAVTALIIDWLITSFLIAVTPWRDI